MRRRFTVIYNPAAGWRRRRRFARVLARLRAAGAMIDLHETQGPGDARTLAAELAPGACDAVLVAGGDGTINEVVNGLAALHSPPLLGLIPLGTANVLAYETGLGTAPEEVARCALEGEALAIRLGRVNERLFVMMAGVGFDAWVVRRVAPTLKRLLGKGAYGLWSLIGLVRYPYGLFDVRIDDRHWCAGSVIVANGRFYGGRFVLAPEARLDDGTLHACILKESGPLAALRYAAALLKGRIHARDDVEIVPCREIAVQGGRSRAIQADGDDIGDLPARICVAGELSLIVPAEQACEPGHGDRVHCGRPGKGA